MPAVTAEGLSPPVTTVDPNYESATPKLKAGVWIPEPGQEKGRPITEADPKSAFAPLHGVRNTWQIKGMESMTTEEYYDNIYKRMAVMKELRQKENGYTRESTRDYLDQINKKNRTGL